MYRWLGRRGGVIFLYRGGFEEFFGKDYEREGGMIGRR